MGLNKKIEGIVDVHNEMNGILKKYPKVRYPWWEGIYIPEHDTMYQFSIIKRGFFGVVILRLRQGTIRIYDEEYIDLAEEIIELMDGLISNTIIVPGGFLKIKKNGIEQGN